MHRHLIALVAVFAVLAVAAASASEKDIVQTLKDDGRFKTLVEAIEKAGLQETLQKESALTVIAPTDDAWQKLPNRETLFGDTQKLADLLKHHIIKEKIALKEQTAAREAKNLRDNTLKIDAPEKKIGAAMVTQNDWEARNGVIHVVDQVLQPDEKRAALDASQTNWLAGFWNSLLPWKGKLDPALNANLKEDSKSASTPQ